MISNHATGFAMPKPPSLTLPDCFDHPIDDRPDRHSTALARRFRRRREKLEEDCGSYYPLRYVMLGLHVGRCPSPCPAANVRRRLRSGRPWPIRPGGGSWTSSGGGRPPPVGSRASSPSPGWPSCGTSPSSPPPAWSPTASGGGSAGTT